MILVEIPRCELRLQELVDLVFSYVIFHGYLTIADARLGESRPFLHACLHGCLVVLASLLLATSYHAALGCLGENEQCLVVAHEELVGVVAAQGAEVEQCGSLVVVALVLYESTRYSAFPVGVATALSSDYRQTWVNVGVYLGIVRILDDHHLYHLLGETQALEVVVVVLIRVKL